jgi:hypothetical protein
LEEVEILRVRESDSELKGRGGRELDRERGMMETFEKETKMMMGVKCVNI